MEGKEGKNINAKYGNRVNRIVVIDGNHRHDLTAGPEVGRSPTKWWSDVSHGDKGGSSGPMKARYVREHSCIQGVGPVPHESELRGEALKKSLGLASQKAIGRSNKWNKVPTVLSTSTAVLVFLGSFS